MDHSTIVPAESQLGCCRLEDLVDSNATIAQKCRIEGWFNQKSKRNIPQVGGIREAFEFPQGLGVGAFEIDLWASTDQTRNAFAHQSCHKPIAVPALLKVLRVNAKFKAIVGVLITCW